MRYYKIVIDGGKTYESFVGGKSLPGALNIELDIPVSPFSAPAGAGYVKIWGISLQEIIQASDNNGKKISVYGGMQKGLPLANPAQSGLLAKGTINQAFGNWIELEQSLDLIFFAEMGTTLDPQDIVILWEKGTKLSDAIKTTLSSGFPKAKVTVQIDDKLVAIEDQAGYYQTVAQFQAWVYGVSKSINKDPNYTGVEIFYADNEFRVYDGTVKRDTKEIVFSDLIGQPTWINPSVMQFKCPMRADLAIDDYIKFPQGAIAATTAPGAAPLGSGIKQKTSFQGVFRISNAHHFGSFRQPDAASWNTTFNCYVAA